MSRWSKTLAELWAGRAPDLPLATPYEALILASIVEKETGLPAERAQIAGVFVRRLQDHMLLQTDPSVIYGMGANYAGNIRKSDLTTDTPYNTYTRSGLPPTPIALAGQAGAAGGPASGGGRCVVLRGSRRWRPRVRQLAGGTQSQRRLLPAEALPMSIPRGKFISLEGGEGAGKSTLLAGLREHIERHGIALVQTREPGGTGVGEAVRAIVLDPALRGLAAETELLLMFASRAQLVREVIEPALAAGQWVLCDRFADASYAYQGGGRGQPAERIAELERWACDGVSPDLTLLLDLPVATGRARAAGRGDADRIEAEADAFFERVRASYRERAAAEPQRFRVIDASQSAGSRAAGGHPGTGRAAGRFAGMSGLPWHAEHWARLQARRQRGALPHALLLCGAAGLGKRAFAQRFVQGLLCSEPLRRRCLRTLPQLPAARCRLASGRGLAEFRPAQGRRAAQRDRGRPDPRTVGAAGHEQPVRRLAGGHASTRPTR